MTTTIIHAGPHKTGTTTIQDFLSANRDWLTAEGVCYPVDPIGLTGHHGLACWLSAPRDLTGPNDLFFPEREIFTAGNGARALAAEELRRIASTDLPIRLVSSEIFSTFDGKDLLNLESFLGPVDRVVLYIRNGLEYLHSCWATKVRWGHQGAFDVFLRDALSSQTLSPIFGPIRFANAVAEIFGPRRLSIRSFDAALTHPRGLTADFLEGELGLPSPAAADAQSISNASPEPFVTELLRAMNIIAARAGDADGYGLLHKNVYTALERDGGMLRVEIGATLGPLMRSISIRDVGALAIDEIGSIRGLGTPTLPAFEAWKFPLDETMSWIDTGALMLSLDRLPRGIDGCAIWRVAV
ncbi:hypothetical protein [Methylocapsa sp. S129]|uniref:hypothetical protein n=1 Tax=Methylocapsa sp. S129 TaxID=1641869 RepID=UPI00131D3675|nr:hypothetical protein [Methylocapsa sp. S129]